MFFVMTRNDCRVERCRPERKREKDTVSPGRCPEQWTTARLTDSAIDAIDSLFWNLSASFSKLLSVSGVTMACSPSIETILVVERIDPTGEIGCAMLPVNPLNGSAEAGVRGPLLSEEPKRREVLWIVPLPKSQEVWFRIEAMDMLRRRSWRSASGGRPAGE